LTELGRFKQAMKIYNKILKKHPNYLPAIVGFHCLHSQMGFKRYATEGLKELLRKSPENRYIQQTLNQITLPKRPSIYASYLNFQDEYESTAHRLYSSLGFFRKIKWNIATSFSLLSKILIVPEYTRIILSQEDILRYPKDERLKKPKILEEKIKCKIHGQSFKLKACLEDDLPPCSVQAKITLGLSTYSNQKEFLTHDLSLLLKYKNFSLNISKSFYELEIAKTLSSTQQVKSASPLPCLEKGITTNEYKIQLTYHWGMGIISGIYNWRDLSDLNSQTNVLLIISQAVPNHPNIKFRYSFKRSSYSFLSLYQTVQPKVISSLYYAPTRLLTHEAGLLFQKRLNQIRLEANISLAHTTEEIYAPQGKDIPCVILSQTFFAPLFSANLEFQPFKRQILSFNYKFYKTPFYKSGFWQAFCTFRF
jgi:tetratricopeptide (TPR) repeat protein